VPLTYLSHQAAVLPLVLTAGAGLVAAASIFINDDPLEGGHAEQP
jgi:hypothetical protein